MKNSKKFLSLLFAIAMLVNVFIVFPISADETGMTFNADDQYKTMTPVAGSPRTFEAWINVDKNASSSRLGVIVGNYSGASTCVNFEIRENGNPYVYWNHKIANFTSVDVRTGEKMHLVIVTSKTDAKCYVNGELKQTINTTDIVDLPANATLNYVIGGDLRANNQQYLKNTQVYSAALYTEGKSADQVSAMMNSANFSDTSLLFAYDLTVSGIERLRDHSANNNHLVYTNAKDSSRNESYVGISKNTEGFEFSSNDSYKMIKTLDKLPKTFEATMRFDKDIATGQRGGVILGNYGMSTRCISFEIFTNGNPRLYWTDTDGTVHNYVFKQVNVYTGEWLSLVITREDTKINCYVDGVLKQSIDSQKLSEDLCPDPLAVGGDLRSGNEIYFKGYLKDLAIYSEVLTAQDIAQNSTKGLIAGYDFNAIPENTKPSVITDVSSNGYDLKSNSIWLDTVEAPKDYAYSFALIGDTQILAESYPNDYGKIYDWILANKDSQKIKFVMGLGDITNSSTLNEWNLAKSYLSKLDGVLPYSLVRGNHDDISNFRKLAKQLKYQDLLSGTFDNNLTNTWQELIVGNIKYLIFTLDYGAKDEVLNWAGDIIKDHPEHNVIITTHAYLYRDGTTLDQGDVCPPATTGGSNNGDHIWEKFASKYENIKLVISGHDPCDRIVVTRSQGVNGNIVTQMLVDPQGVDAAKGATGLVAMLYFSEDGKDVTVRYYSTVREKYFMEENQFDLKIECISSSNDVDVEVDQNQNDTNVTPSDEKKKGGCKSFASGYVALVSVISLAGAYVFSKKKMNN